MHVLLGNLVSGVTFVVCGGLATSHASGLATAVLGPQFVLHLQQYSCTGELAAIEECGLVYSRCCSVG